MYIFGEFVSSDRSSLSHLVPNQIDPSHFFFLNLHQCVYAKTQNLNEANSETFFCTKYFRDFFGSVGSVNGLVGFLNGEDQHP